jgi:hypothetical protein
MAIIDDVVTDFGFGGLTRYYLGVLMISPAAFRQYSMRSDSAARFIWERNAADALVLRQRHYWIFRPLGRQIFIDSFGRD